MTIRFFLFLSLSLLGMASCQQKDEGDEVQQAEKEVFKIHDEVMPRIDEIMKLRKALKARIAAADSAQKGQATPSAALRTDEDKAQAMRLNRQLAEADSLMMDWMSQYKGDSLMLLKKEQALRYLEGEKQKITDVQKKIDASIADTRQFLGTK